MKTFWMICLLTLSSIYHLQAQTPSLIEQGFDAYRSSGRIIALSTWLKDSPLLLETTTSDKITQDFSRFEKIYGTYQSHQILRTVPITPSLDRVYAVLFLERGPLYISFDVYKKTFSQTITTLNITPQADLFLPPDLIYGK